MKQSRRQELKTNELSIWLQQTYAAAVRNANYLIGGLVVVVLILIVALYVRNRRHSAREDAWNHFYSLNQRQPNDKPAVILEQARQFAETHADDADLGPRARLTVANMVAAAGAEIGPLQDPAARLQLLKEARDRYNKSIAENADEPKLLAQARIGLAGVLENLVLMGEASTADVRQQYEAIEKMPDGLYKENARTLLNTLDERLRPLHLVATRPAETMPATQAVPASGPASAPAVPPAESSPATTTAP